MLLIYENADARKNLTPELVDEMQSWMKEITDSGELIGTEALADSSTAKTVRVEGGVPVVTDGPFAEAKEYMGGYLLVDCESFERAVEIARRWSKAPHTAMEVRPLMNQGGTEM